MNKVVLIGRLTKDVEVRYTTNEKIVAMFSLAVNRDFKNQKGEYEADFFNIVMWGKPAELAGNTLKKGSKIAIDGRIQNRSYEAKDGTKRYVTEIIANGFEYLEKREQPKDMASMGTDVTKDAPFDDFVPF
jgi:single-strand DNA-binding protein